MKRKISCAFMTALLCMSLFACGNAKEAEGYAVSEELQAMYEAYMESADPTFAYDIAVELSQNPDFFNSNQGGRNAGSDAEHKAAEWLQTQMQEIGLKDTELAAADCDKQQFNGASLKVEGLEAVIEPYSYASGSTLSEGITSEIIYVADGTMWDYEDMDVEGKIVLIDINQRENWWITYPYLEADLQGAAAIMAANVGGFSEVSGDAKNANDICAPVGIPCVSISLNESKGIQKLLEKGPVTGTLVVDNEVSIGDGTTYNVIGKIPGKSSDNMILVGGHYDTHFYGFQDDSCAVGLVLAMAKSMVDSGYIPENDIVFCLHGAEEWGASNTQFDWTTGAWEMINTVYPDWQGKILSFINFELPAYEFDKYTSTYSAPEMYSMIDFYANTFPLSPEPEGCFEEGVLTEGYQTYTYSDDFSYYAAGVPSTVNGFLLQKDMETVFPFYEQYYHTDFDLPDTYNEAVMTFNLKYYGGMAMYIDQTPALYLDFTAQYDRIMASVDEDILGVGEFDVDSYKAKAEELKTAAEALRNKTVEVNDAYMQAWIDGDEVKMSELWAEGKKLTQKNLDAFKYAQTNLLGLMYERPIVPHEAPQENISLINQTLDCLEQGDIVAAADEYAWQINNILEWYAMYFSPEVIANQNNMFWGEENQDNLYWGTGINFTMAPVEAATRGLMQKYGQENADVTAEINVYKAAVAQQTEIMIKLANKEIEDMGEFAGMLEIE
jgi:Iap family predicted aminopeptidase